jgi:enamine deaminase RidA (YjgF/YER057c/UK114 family)
MNTVQPENQPQPKGHYAPGVEHDGLIYVSGRLPMLLETRGTQIEIQAVAAKKEFSRE